MNLMRTVSKKRNASYKITANISGHYGTPTFSMLFFQASQSAWWIACAAQAQSGQTVELRKKWANKTTNIRH